MKKKIIILILTFSSFGCATTQNYDNSPGTADKIASWKEAQDNTKNPYERLRAGNSFMFFWQRWHF
jgi:hypothetical protein